MSEPTNPPATPSKPQVDVPAGFVAFVNLEQKRVYGVTFFKHKTIGFTSLTLVAKPSYAELQTELGKLGLSYTPPAPPQA